MIAAPEKAAPIPAEVRKLELWFFRDLTEEQRMKLFALFGAPVSEIRTHSHEQLVFRHIMRALPADRQARPSLPDSREERIRAEAAEDEQKAFFNGFKAGMERALMRDVEFTLAEAVGVRARARSYTADRARAHQGGNNG